MNPAPRPPSPSARAATQRALRRENTEQLSTRDTRILGLVADGKNERVRSDPIFGNAAIAEGEGNPSSASTPKAAAQLSAPPRPSRQLGRMSTGRNVVCFSIKKKLLLF